MTAKSYNRGHEIYYNGKEWVYTENDEPLEDRKPCKRCGVKPNILGHDYCMQGLTDCRAVQNACCGHGVTRGYIQLSDGRVFREEKD